MAMATPTSARSATAPLRWASPTSTASASRPTRAHRSTRSGSEEPAMTISQRFLASIAGAALAACGIDTAAPAPDPRRGASDGTLRPPVCTVRGPRMTRRLSNLQLRNTLQAVFQDTSVPTGDVLNDPVILGFKADATQSVVRDLDAQLIMNNA